MLLYEEKIRDNKQEAVNKIKDISTKLGINPNWLMYVINHESGFNPKAYNPDGGATGLIQFMPTTANGLGTTTAELMNMNTLQQLDYVYKYFKRGAGKFHSIYDLYLFTFYPYAMGKPDTYIIGSEKSFDYAKKIKSVNYPRKSGDTISLGEWYELKKEQILKSVPQIYQSQFQKKKV